MDGKEIAVHSDTGELLKTEFDKMSKSKYNGVDPQVTTKCKVWCV